MSNSLQLGQLLRLHNGTVDPTGIEGAIYFKSDSFEFRVFANGAWDTLTTGEISLVNQTLSQYNVIVGSAANLSAAVDTNSVGDILVDSTGGLNIKSGVIVNADINASAAIARTKLASGTAYRLAANDASGVLADAAAITADRALISDANGVPTHSAVTQIELGYVSGVTSAIQTQLNAKVNKAGDTMSGALNMGSNLITNVSTPVSATDAANKAYVDSVAQGLDTKDSVRAATTGNITLSGPQAIDGVSIIAGDRVLVKSQSTVANNGIYVAAAGAWSRSLDMDSYLEVPNAFAFIEEGTTLGDTGWVCTSDASGTLGVTAITFSQFSGAGSYTADGQGIELAGTQFQLELDGSTLDKSGTGLKVSTGGINNNEVNASAAIAYSKLAALTASRALVSNGSGFVSVSAVTDVELGYVSGVTSALQTQLDDKANRALSNLASVALNTSLISSTNNAHDLGSDAIEFKDLFAHSIKHGDVTNPDLAISTLSNNGSVIVTAHGTGSLDLKANKVRMSEDGASSNFMEQEYYDAISLTGSQSNTVLTELTFAHASFVGLKLQFTILESVTNRVRIGRLEVVTNGTNISFIQDFNETGDCGVTFDAIVNGANINIRYTSTANTKTMRSHVTRFRA